MVIETRPRARRRRGQHVVFVCVLASSTRHQAQSVTMAPTTTNLVRKSLVPTADSVSGIQEEEITPVPSAWFSTRSPTELPTPAPSELIEPLSTPPLTSSHVTEPIKQKKHERGTVSGKMIGAFIVMCFIVAGILSYTTASCYFEGDRPARTGIYDEPPPLLAQELRRMISLDDSRESSSSI